MSFCLKNLSMIKDIKQHWDYVHTDQSRSFSRLASFFFGRQNYEFFDLCKKYLTNKWYANIFEVWCAPGNFLIHFYKKYWYTPYGIEYSKQGYDKTLANMKANKTGWEILYWDFFDESFLAAHKEHYDVVMSLWFIEHYDDPSQAIRQHFDLVKKGGTVIITIPNLHGLNKVFVPQNILDIHNIGIMNEHTLRDLFSPYDVLCIQRYWWPVNVGLYFYKNRLLEYSRLACFAFQRIVFDPIMILLYKLGVKCNGISAPQWIVICQK